MIVFAGGCAVVSVVSGALPLVVVPASIVVANVAIILAVRLKRKPSFLAFVSLALLDLGIGLPMLFVMLVNPNVHVNLEDSFQLGLLLLAFALVLKGILTIAAASWLRTQGRQAAVDGDTESEQPSRAGDLPLRGSRPVLMPYNARSSLRHRCINQKGIPSWSVPRARCCRWAPSPQTSSCRTSTDAW
jgi:hypothetical protein